MIFESPSAPQTPEQLSQPQAQVSPGQPPPAQPPEPAKYEDLITDEAVTQTGLFTVHHVGEKWYLEIPQKLLGKDMLWYAELDDMPVGLKPMGGLEIAARLVRLEQVDRSIYVRDLTHPLKKIAGDPSLPEDEPPTKQLRPVFQALIQTSLPAAIMAFPILADSPDGGLLIEGTGVFTADLPDFSPKAQLASGGYVVAAIAPERCHVRSIIPFPRNVNIESFLTFSTTGGLSNSVSVVVQHSITLLPEQHMPRRRFDPRIGYFTVGFDDYSGEETHGVLAHRYITRYRLEKKRAQAKISKPKKPIVYYISREVPEKWRPYLKQAVEDWQPAFEAAGFREAIIAKDAPSIEEDPHWDPGDTRHSVVRWLTQPVANAVGPHTHDPRTGEILSAHILIWAKTPNLAEQWYFSQASAADESAQSLPLSDELVGQLMRYVVAHEVGHTLGLRHNHRASQVFTTEQLRDPDFTARYGTAPSIMSYGRFNYLAQPGDGVTHFIPQIGPYDEFAIAWGYRPIPGADSPADEQQTLNRWAERQIDDPFLAFGGEDIPASVDPNVLTENLGADRIEATRLGILNLERMMKYLVAATTRQDGDFSTLGETYTTILGQRQGWLASVVKLIGGVEETRTMAGHGPQFHRVSAERQHTAATYLVDNLRTPHTFLNPEVLDLLTPKNPMGEVELLQKALLASLLQKNIYLQLANAEQLDPDTQHYSTADLLSDVQAGLFEELQADSPVIDPLRRRLQRHYLSILKKQMSDPDSEKNAAALAALGPLGEALASLITQAEGTDIRAAGYAGLTRLREELQAAVLKTVDATTRYHLSDLDRQIGMILKDAG
ncbi:MAG: zinc-dependent metalloprotease [Chloroflexota bacterium]|nr:zinc-dependent metalloprotease [Chloroflexota bacterium]